MVTGKSLALYVVDREVGGQKETRSNEVAEWTSYYLFAMEVWIKVTVYVSHLGTVFEQLTSRSNGEGGRSVTYTDWRGKVEGEAGGGGAKVLLKRDGIYVSGYIAEDTYVWDRYKGREDSKR